MCCDTVWNHAGCLSLQLRHRGTGTPGGRLMHGLGAQQPRCCISLTVAHIAHLGRWLGRVLLFSMGCACAAVLLMLQDKQGVAGLMSRVLHNRPGSCHATLCLHFGCNSLVHLSLPSCYCSYSGSGRFCWLQPPLVCCTCTRQPLAAR